MNPTKIESDDCGLQIQNNNKETQTSGAIIICHSETSTQIPNTSSNQSLNKDSITVFKFCKILQDPECPKSVTIIKESVSEEVQKHPKKPSSEEGVANRYKYCKEVIKPYLQSYPPNSPSDETLIKEVLESVHQDFPDYEPCSDKYQDESLIDSRQSSKVDAVTSYDSKPSQTKMEKDKNKSSTKIQQRPGCFPKDFDTPSGVPDPGCEIKSAKSFKSEKSEKSVECIKSPCSPKKKASPIVCDPSCEAECAVRHVEKKKSPTNVGEGGCPPPIDYCTRAPNISKTPSQESIGKKFKKSSPVPEKKASVTDKKEKAPEPKDNKEVPKTDSQCSSISQIKCAVEDFITKVCTATHETATMIRKGSVGQIEDSTKSPCDEAESDEKSEGKSKGFSFFRKVDSLSKEENDSSEILSSEGIIDLVDKVDSTLSNISDTIDFDNLPEPLTQENFDDSPSDKPTPPKEISNIIVQTNITHAIPVPQSSSVFAAIKTRICSLFSDEKKQDSESSSSSYSQQSEADEDTDLTERFIE